VLDAAWLNTVHPKYLWDPCIESPLSSPNIFVFSSSSTPSGALKSVRLCGESLLFGFSSLSFLFFVIFVNFVPLW
jgi:hypothetical protein